jgi:hypothetical protein
MKLNFPLRAGLFALLLWPLASCTTESLSDFSLCGIFSCEAESQFQEIADSLGGEFHSVNDSVSAGDIVQNILDSNVVGGTDVVFLIDRTGSMYDDIDAVKAVTSRIVTALGRHTDVRLAMGFFQDIHVDGDSWYQMNPLSHDHSPALAALADVEVDGGGDTPESLYDAMAKALDELNWSSSSKKLLLVIGDAPSHTGRLTSHSLSDLKTKTSALGASFVIYTILTSPL